MAKETSPIPAPSPVQPSFARFILWEILGIVGFLHVLEYAPADDPTPLLFLCNAAAFLALYPVLYFYHQLKMPPFLKPAVRALEAVLRALLMVSGALWVSYVAYASGFHLGPANCFAVIKSYWMFLAPLYVLDYFLFFEHLWGVSRVNFTFWVSVGMISDSVSGVVGGFYLGRTLVTKWGMFLGAPETQGLLWCLFILSGVAVVVWFGNKTRKG
jgi:hypothetical protein